MIRKMSESVDKFDSVESKEKFQSRSYDCAGIYMPTGIVVCACVSRYVHRRVCLGVCVVVCVCVCVASFWLPTVLPIRQFILKPESNVADQGQNRTRRMTPRSRQRSRMPASPACVSVFLKMQPPPFFCTHHMHVRIFAALPRLAIISIWNVASCYVYIYRFCIQRRVEWSSLTSIQGETRVLLDILPHLSSVSMMIEESWLQDEALKVDLGRKLQALNGRVGQLIDGALNACLKRIRRAQFQLVQLPVSGLS